MRSAGRGGEGGVVYQSVKGKRDGIRDGEVDLEQQGGGTKSRTDDTHYKNLPDISARPSSSVQTSLSSQLRTAQDYFSYNTFKETHYTGVAGV